MLATQMGFDIVLLNVTYLTQAEVAFTELILFSICLKGGKEDWMRF
jgi:hypothetical protein